MLVVVRVVSLFDCLFYGGVDGMSMDLGSVGAPFCHILVKLNTDSTW